MKDWFFLFEKWVLGKRGGWRSRPESKVKSILGRMEGGLFIDVGANEGGYCLLLARKFTKVFAFEPNPKVLPRLRERVAAYANITIFEKALSNRNSTTILFSNPFSDKFGKSDSILKNYATKTDDESGQYRTFVGEKGASVDTVTYDSFIAEKADLVKIDVEGAEFLVLEGMRNSLGKGLVNCVVIELHNVDERERLSELVKDYGFDVMWIDPIHLLGTLRPRAPQ